MDYRSRPTPLNYRSGDTIVSPPARLPLRANLGFFVGLLSLFPNCVCDLIVANRFRDPQVSAVILCITAAGEFAAGLLYVAYCRGGGWPFPIGVHPKRLRHFQLGLATGYSTSAGLVLALDVLGAVGQLFFQV